MIVRTQTPQDLSNTEVAVTDHLAASARSEAEVVTPTSSGTAGDQSDCRAGDSTKPKFLSTTDFLKLSSESGLVQIGAAGVNLDDSGSLIFFSDPTRIADQTPTLIPLRRIVRIELLKDTLIQNTPLNLPSLWLVRLHLSRTETSQKARLDTVFEH